MSGAAWKKLEICRADLHLSLCLGGGQSFRWKTPKLDKWIGVFRNRVWILCQEDSHLLYQCFGRMDSGVDSDEESEHLLKSYLRLDMDLNSLYKSWSDADPHFKKSMPSLTGIRILNQEVTENIFSFICSSNNNIKRISSMVETLCELFGDPIAEVDSKMFKSFPTFDRLAGDGVESSLRNAGFGYRAKYIYQSALKIGELGGSRWLEDLKLLPYQVAKSELLKLPGVGPKVADCICLMSLGHFEAVPVDTHIFQVASKDYLPHLKKYKSMNNKVYNEIADHYRSLHGPYAGWANTVLFCSDLKLMNPCQVKEEITDESKET